MIREHLVEIKFTIMEKKLPIFYTVYADSFTINLFYSIKRHIMLN